MAYVFTDVSSPRGAPMGRPSVIPEGLAPFPKLRLELIRMYDGCYDKGGAYWGAPTSGDHMYVAWSAELGVEVFTRATSRELAKRQVRERVPGARFY